LSFDLVVQAGQNLANILAGRQIGRGSAEAGANLYAQFVEMLVGAFDK
jgi:hypothetical protein